MKTLNLEELALLAGVSKTTVSLILNGRAEQYRISPATRERVLALAEAHQFTPDANAASLRSGRDRSVGVVIPDYGHGPAVQLLASCSHNDAAHLLLADNSAGLAQALARRLG